MKLISKLFINLALMLALSRCNFPFPTWSYSEWKAVKLKVPFCSGSDKFLDEDILKNKISKNDTPFPDPENEEIKNTIHSILQDRSLENSKKRSLLKTYGYVELDMPWDTGGAKAILQERQFCGAMQSRGCSTEKRLFSIKRPNTNYIKNINEYLSKNNWIKSLQNRNYNELEYKIISINPVIVIISPKKDKKNIIDTKYGKCYLNSDSYIFSSYLQNRIKIGTKFSFHNDILWFSPDLNKGPEKLNIEKGSSFKIQWDNRYIIFIEKDGEITTKYSINHE